MIMMNMIMELFNLLNAKLFMVKDSIYCVLINFNILLIRKIKKKLLENHLSLFSQLIRINL